MGEDEIGGGGIGGREGEEREVMKRDTEEMAETKSKIQTIFLDFEDKSIKIVYCSNKR